MVTSERLGLLILIGVEVAISACAPGPEPASAVTDAVTTALFSGTVVDGAGAPVAGARVTVNGVARTTASNGQYTMSVVQATAGYHLDVRKDGFGPVTEFRMTGGVSLVHHLVAGTTFVIAPDVAATLVDQRTGIRVVVPANSLRSNAGAPSGSVRFTIIPHSSDTMPGDFTARNASQRLVTLVSVGAVTLQAVDSAGNTLGLISGAAPLQVTLPVPASAGGVMPTCVRAGTCRAAAWRYDPATALWIEAPTSALTLGSIVSVFTTPFKPGPIPLGDGLGTWNIDIEFDNPACTMVQLIGIPDLCYNPLGANSPPGITLTASQALATTGTKTKTAIAQQNTALVVLWAERPNVNLDLSVTFPPGAPASCAASLMIFTDPAETPGFPMISSTGAQIELSTGAPWGGTGVPTSPVDGLPLSVASPDLDMDGIPDNPCHSLVQILSM